MLFNVMNIVVKFSDIVLGSFYFSWNKTNC